MRHPQIGASHFVAKVTSAHVVNAGDGKHQHPTQALLDLYTLREEFGRLEGLHVAIVGDVLHSRVARSLIQALDLVGANGRSSARRRPAARVEAMGCETSTAPRSAAGVVSRPPTGGASGCSNCSRPEPARVHRAVGRDSRAAARRPEGHAPGAVEQGSRSTRGLRTPPTR